MRTVRTKVYKFAELDRAAKNLALALFNDEYRLIVERLRYAKEFTPHKVAYYEDQLTEIVTRKTLMPENYEFTEEGRRII